MENRSAWMAIEGVVVEGGEVDAVFYFPKLPLGGVSDEVGDVVSYERYIEIIQRVAREKEYQLIEHLAYRIHGALKKELPIYLEIMVKVRKRHPELKRGVEFTYFPKREETEKKPVRGWEEE